MSSPEELKVKRVKRYKRLAIISAYLLALLWPLGSFFVWILLGAIVYFLFLIYYNSPRTIRPQGRTEYERPGRNTQSNPNQARPVQVDKKTLGLVIVIVTVVIIFIALFIAIINFTNDTTSDSSTSQDSSEDEYRDAIASNPTDTDALINLGNIFYSRSEYDSAMKYYEITLKSDPSNSSGLHNKALVLQQQKKYSKSTEVIKQCLSLYPDFTDAMLLLGDNYYFDEKYNEALPWYEKAYNKGERNAGLLNIMAYIYDTQNKRSDAIRLYKETLALDSSLVSIYTRLAELEPTRAEWYKKKAEEFK